MGSLALSQSTRVSISMANITSVSQTELASRRHQLQQARRIKVIQTIWRTLAVSSLAGGMVWVITLPGWVIQQPDQIAIAGNKLLSPQTIRRFLSLNYPQSLFRVEPQILATRLEETGPIAQATVSRQLFPPRLTIQITERQPVAIAISSQTAPNAPQVGLLDAKGTWMPIENYNTLKSNALPALKITGWRAQALSQWPELYQLLNTSAIKISEINWQNPNNLILQTELGLVHCGPYSPALSIQLKVLAQMRQLPKQINPGQIAYIDLKNPNAPSVQFK